MAIEKASNNMVHQVTKVRMRLQVLEYIDEAMPPETPLAFGLHPNAEIGFKLREAERFCANVLCLQPREAGGEGGMSVEEKAKMVSMAPHQTRHAEVASMLTAHLLSVLPTKQSANRHEPNWMLFRC